ncbi:hypothetical protein [Marinospirillum alkaliphilum]|uniref:Uncharacterized protein n=1 Tax=Marinospirillum alkaliphilum DSM 21637 TaxID=1122209 RepID=A0A1K1W4I9_9GAMM|nr:hypothetical protein [Marinospirillum alkaliphilum]SFX32067.1 hypothetical protein SAMN02745752_01268 [Marinospirillum alkaliphilum DSM 21637]
MNTFRKAANKRLQQQQQAPAESVAPATDSENLLQGITEVITELEVTPAVLLQKQALYQKLHALHQQGCELASRQCMTGPIH